MLWNLRPRGHEGGNAFFILYPLTLRFYDSSLWHISRHSAYFPATFIWHYMLIDFYTIFPPIRLLGLHVYLALQSRTQDLLKVLMVAQVLNVKILGGHVPLCPPCSYAPASLVDLIIWDPKTMFIDVGIVFDLTLSILVNIN